jgi:DNA polymerase-3 subunit gamma/tau
LIDQVRIPPQTGKYKVYIIDEVHMLSSHLMLLKTLEEPPKHAILFMATEKHKDYPNHIITLSDLDLKRITVKMQRTSC